MTTADDRLAPLGQRLARDLTRRALAGRVPRVFIAIGQELAPLAEAAFERVAAQLSDDETARWLRELDALRDAVIEIAVGPGAGPPAIVRPDSPLEHVLRDLDLLAGRERLIAAAVERGDPALDELAEIDGDDESDAIASRRAMCARISAGTLRAAHRS